MATQLWLLQSLAGAVCAHRAGALTVGIPSSSATTFGDGAVTPTRMHVAPGGGTCVGDERSEQNETERH